MEIEYVKCKCKWHNIVPQKIQGNSDEGIKNKVNNMQQLNGKNVTPCYTTIIIEGKDSD